MYDIASMKLIFDEYPFSAFFLMQLIVRRCFLLNSIDCFKGHGRPCSVWSILETEFFAVLFKHSIKGTMLSLLLFIAFCNPEWNPSMIWVVVGSPSSNTWCTDHLVGSYNGAWPLRRWTYVLPKYWYNGFIVLFGFISLNVEIISFAGKYASAFNSLNSLWILLFDWICDAKCNFCAFLRRVLEG